MSEVTYLFMDQRKVYTGTAEDTLQALRVCKEMGGLEVFILNGNVEQTVRSVGLKKVYNLVRIAQKYNLEYESTT